MINIEKLLETNLFIKKSFEVGEYVFRENEIDENIYIISSGIFEVQKFITSDAKDYRQIATLKELDIFGESSINKTEKKKSSISCLKSGELIFINGKIGIEKLVKNFPEIGLNLFKYIISRSNLRINLSNHEITSLHEVSKKIANIGEVNYKSLVEILDFSSKVLENDELIYIEKVFGTEKFIQRFSSNNSGKLGNEVFENLEDFIEKNNFPQKFFSLQEIKIGGEIYGYIFVKREKLKLTENEEKILANISGVLVGFLKQLKENKGRA